MPVHVHVYALLERALVHIYMPRPYRREHWYLYMSRLYFLLSGNRVALCLFYRN